MNIKKSLFGMLVLVVTAGCNNASPGYKPEEVKLVSSGLIKAGEERRLFPLERGNQWVFDIETTIIRPDGKRETDQKEMTYRCTSVLKQGKRTYYDLESVIGDDVIEIQRWYFEEGVGYFQVSVGYPAKPFEPPICAVRLPLEPGNRFDWKGVGYVPEGIKAPSTATTKILGLQQVDTGLGRMEGYAFETEVKWASGLAKQSTWWAKDVGIARYRQEVVAVAKDQKGNPIRIIAISVMRLKSMSLKSTAKGSE
ncbi:MAG: hypothetical protein J0L72_07710 [Armatimonadetes bacterium]|nr:hypothetical protein [Armatimonadota bacterium]